MSDGGQVVAGWVLEERLGSGSFGEVWKVRRQHVDLYRALKLVRISDEQAFEGWHHEIVRLEALSHANIVRFYDADIVAEGPFSDHAWIATELCDHSLAQELRRRPGGVLSEQECETLLLQMLAALDAAESSGCVHRDVKPGNILWHRSGAWKLCDFGTARLIPSGATHVQTQVVGTYPYMSQAAHHGHQDHFADLYAMGVTVHEALCGRRLHARTQGMTDSEYLKFVMDTPPTISTQLPRRWQTVVEALTGVHGRHGANRVRQWFVETRGLTLSSLMADGDGGQARATEPDPAWRLDGSPAPTPATGPTVARRADAPGWVGVPRDPTAVVGRRCASFALDWLIFYVFFGLFFLLALNNEYEEVPRVDETGSANPCAAYEDSHEACREFLGAVYVAEDEPWMADLAFLVPVGQVLLEGLAGGSLGQLMVGLRTVRADGRRAGVGRVLVRWVLWIVDGAPWCFPLLGLIVGSADRRHRRVGDRVAGTYVVRSVDAGRPIGW